MASPSRTINRETHFPSTYFVFPPYGDVGPPLMVTLILPGLTIELPVWLLSSPVIPYKSIPSNPNPSSREHQPHVDPSSSSPYVVDEIVIDANMGLQWPHRMSLMPPCPTCSALTPYRVSLHLAVPWTPYKVGLCLEAPCTQLTRSLYPQAYILNPPPC